MLILGSRARDIAIIHGLTQENTVMHFYIIDKQLFVCSRNKIPALPACSTTKTVTLQFLCFLKQDKSLLLGFYVQSLGLTLVGSPGNRKYLTKVASKRQESKPPIKSPKRRI